MIFSILTDAGVGGTFVSWSLHYLAGHKKYLHAPSNSTKKVPSDPITKLNAHNFKSNQAGTFNDFNNILEALIKHKTNTFHHIYFHLLSRYTNSDLKDSENTTKAIELLQPYTEKNIVITLTGNQQLYLTKLHNRIIFQQRKSLNDLNIILKNEEETLKDYLDFYFSESIQGWNDLSKVWDFREFLAFSKNPFLFHKITDNINASLEYYNLDPMNLWTKFDKTVYNMFDYLELKIDADRYIKWLPIYNKWKTLHLNRVLFVENFDTIIEHILNGHNLDLTKFELDVMQEAAIQYVLIHKYNLNLKTWQLEKFTNTQQLYNLLEPL